MLSKEEPKMIKTWHIESLVVFLILALSTYFLSLNRLTDWLTALAVQLTFHYVSVASRLEEQNQKTSQPLECHLWLRRYLIGKEITWVLVFLTSHLYTALIGTAIFLIYPFYRRLWRKYHPIA